MKNYCLFLLLPFLILFACNSNPNKGVAVGDAAPALPVTRKVSDIEPLLSKADSVQVIYYDNPGDDSLRYTRFFTVAEISDTSQVKSLLNEMDQGYVQEPRKRTCRSEGKLYLLQKGDVLKTVYFSTTGDSCTYFYFIKDGSFIYFPLTGAAAKILQQKKQWARKPKAGV